MGPGTHIIERINQGVMPIDLDDASALVHDLNYLYANGRHAIMDVADDQAMEVGHSAVMTTGLTLRKWLHLKETPGEPISPELLHHLKQLVKEKGLLKYYPQVESTFLF